MRKLHVMDLVLLESLLAVADAGTITEAADRIGISQSALSRRLQQLERELGAELLARGRHGVELTELGRQCVTLGRGIVTRYAQLRQNVVEQLGLVRGAVRVGGGATATSFLIPPAIGRFQRDHPGIRFYVKEAGSLEVAAAVASGELELGVVTLPVPARELDVTDLCADDIVLVARGDHELSAPGCTADDLAGQSVVAFEPMSAIRQIIDAALREAGVQIEVVMELRSIPSILKMVVTTGALAFVSRVSLDSEPGLVEVPVRGLSISRTLGLVTRRGVRLAVPAAAFASVLRAQVIAGS
jgi:DNA-binding transcriptional LysR family regulator